MGLTAILQTGATENFIFLMACAYGWSVTVPDLDKHLSMPINPTVLPAGIY